MTSSSEDRFFRGRSGLRTNKLTRTLFAAAGIACGLSIGIPARAQTCPLSYGNTDAAKSHWLFLYFPTASDSTFPAYDTNVSPVAAFDVSSLTTGIGTTAQLIDEIGKVVTDDYCEFDVQVHTTTTNPASLPSPPARRVTVGIGADSDGNATDGYQWGKSQELDIGDKIDIDFARIWAGTYVNCEGGDGAGNCSTSGALTGSNNTLEHWAQAIGGTAAHEAGHTYGLQHTDDDPPNDIGGQPGPTPTPGEDPYYKHLMPAGYNLTGLQRTEYRRHFSDRTFGILATNVGLSIQTMHNWDLKNPNAESGYSLAIDFLSALPAVNISWSYGGATSPWLNPVVTGPSGTAVFKGTTYNKYTITWSSPNPAWNDSAPGVVAGGAVFHIGTTFTGVDFDTPNPIIIQDVTLFDAASKSLALHPRLPGYDAGTVDASDGSFAIHFFPIAGGAMLKLESATVYQLPRVASIESMVGEGRPLTHNRTPIVPWTSTTCKPADLGDGATCTVSNIKQPPHVKEVYLAGQPGVYDCSQGVPKGPSRNPDQRPSTAVRDASRPLDYEGPICAGSQQDPFPSATVYVIAKFVEPNAKHWDRAAKKYVVGPVASTTYYQFAGIRQRQTSSKFEYAAKLVCGPTEHSPEENRWPRVARGAYFTAINVHNPSREPATIRFKVAATERGGRPGPISSFSEIKLGADEAISLSCSQAYELLHAKPEFLDGFGVLESDVEQDVVAVYTAAGERDDKVQTLHTERVPVRALR